MAREGLHRPDAGRRSKARPNEFVETVALRLHATYSPHCDFALHEVGSVLRDQISQGQADGDQFRTAPLWGIGQCIFFLHDGRTDDLLQAIQAHAGNGSEANAVIGAFNALPASLQQYILNFLRSL